MSETRSKELVYLNTAIWRLYRVSGVLIEYSAYNCRYSDVIPSDTLIMGYLPHIKLPMAVRRPFIMSLYGRYRCGNGSIIAFDVKQHDFLQEKYEIKNKLQNK